MTHPARAHIHAPHDVGARLTDLVAGFAGSWRCIILHAVWFALWLWLHLDINALTMIVSLEAIFLSSILLLASNRQAAKDRARDDLEASEVDGLLASHRTLLDLTRTVHDINRTQLDILKRLEPPAP